MQARFDKFGKQLPDTGHGCGCELCARSNAPRYERRRHSRGAGSWGRIRRRLARLARTIGGSRPQAA